MASSSKKWKGDSSDPDYVPTGRSTKRKSNKTKLKKKNEQKPTPTPTPAKYTYSKVVEPDAEFILISQSDRRDDKWSYLRECKNCGGPFFAQMNYTPTQHFVGWKHSLMSICNTCTVEFESRSAESESEPTPPVISTVQQQSKEDSDSDTDTTVPGRTGLPSPSNKKRKGATQSSSTSVSVLHNPKSTKSNTTAKSATSSTAEAAVTEESGKERERAAYYTISTSPASPLALPKEVHFQSIYEKEPGAALMMTKNNLSDTEDSDDSEFKMAEIFSSKFRHLLHFAEMLIEAWDLRQIITEQQENEE